MVALRPHRLLTMADLLSRVIITSIFSEGFDKSARKTPSFRRIARIGMGQRIPASLTL